MTTITIELDDKRLCCIYSAGCSQTLDDPAEPASAEINSGFLFGFRRMLTEPRDLDSGEGVPDLHPVFQWRVRPTGPRGGAG